MRLAVLLLGLALVAAACGQDDEQAAAPTASGGAALADLTVTVDRDGDGAGKPRSATVQCEAAGDSDTCAALADIKPETFKPVPATQACTQIYGGPEVAKVTGTLHGRPVDAEFSRTDGCQISRWDDASALLGAAG